MTLIFNRDRYGELLARYQPKPIKTEAENEEALALVEELMHREAQTPEEDALYELLIVLTEKFEREYYFPGQFSTPDSLLRFLMEQRGIARADLVGIFGSEEVVSEIVNGKRAIEPKRAKILGEFFHVDPSLFL
ncbi:transcriptional regulator [Pannus brasiliensis CCIBt3594]|uniref:Transcriptional regulator n=1 Tax=Pannus brasiliensis CCIBt3594 TaxID=1427578 RepID=A0AAW9R0I3_9CHRO